MDGETEPCSEEGLCLTPFSQASTAPCTPLRFFLPDPVEVDMCMSMLCEQYKQTEPTDSFNAPPQPVASFLMSPPPLSVAMSPWWAEYKQRGTQTFLGSCETSRKSACAMPRSQQQFAVLEFVDKYERQETPTDHMPRSQELFAVLEFVENYNKYMYQETPDEHPRSQQFFAVLGFVGNYYEYQVRKEPRSQQLFAVLESVGNHYEYQARKEPRSQQQFAVLELAENHDYQVVKNAGPIKHFGLDIAGLMKHFGLNIKEGTQSAELEHVDSDDDEWTKVNQLYIPSEHDGMCVLAVNIHSGGLAAHVL